MGKKSKVWKGAEMLKNYGASKKTVNEFIAKNAMDAVTAQHGKGVPPGAYLVNLDIDYAALEERVMNMPEWHPLPMDIRVASGLVEDRLAFTARTANSGYMRFTVRLSELDKRENARVIQSEHPVSVSRTMATLPDCGWLLPQLLAAREQYQAELWAVIKGDKQ